MKTQVIKQNVELEHTFMMMEESESDSDSRQPELLEVGKHDSEDRISRLPDPIPCHILSFLPAKHAVATRNLSSRWNLVWTWLSNLCFDDELCERPAINMHIDDALTKDTAQRFDKFEHRLSLRALDPLFGLTNTFAAMNAYPRIGFEDFVNWVLDRNNSATLAKFSLQCSNLTDLSLLKFWVSSAIMRNVREIEIYLESHGLHTLFYFFERQDPVKLPESLCTSTTLEVLVLYSDLVINIPPSGLCFPCLKFLHIELYCLPNNLTERLFSACPVLEELSIVGLLINADVVTNFNISSRTLKKLGIRFDIGDQGSSYNEHKILIRAPNLERFHIIDHALVSYMVHELHSLTEAFIDVSYFEWPSPSYVERPLPQAKRVLELLEGVNEIKFMSLSAETMFALDLAYEEFFPTFPNLTYLEVHIGGTSWKLLLAILNSLPNLEVLLIHSLAVCDSGFIFEEPVPRCLLFHVKKIEMRSFGGYEHEFQLVKYFLKNIVSLEKLIVKSWARTSQEKLKQCQELLMFERASKFCQVEFL